jgi:outer membrane protein
MKKTILIIGIAISIISCKEATKAESFKTAYIDTSELLKNYTEAKDIEAKFKSKSEEQGRQLDLEVARFKAEASNFERNAKANGQAWAQQKGAELQQRQQQLQYAEQEIVQKLQQESGVEMDSLVSNVKKFIKEYSKEKGYDYVYGTGEAASILYAKEKYDITDEVVKLLNKKYSSGEKLESKKETNAATKK